MHESKINYTLGHQENFNKLQIKQITQYSQSTTQKHQRLTVTIKRATIYYTLRARRKCHTKIRKLYEHGRIEKRILFIYGRDH